MAGLGLSLLIGGFAAWVVSRLQTEWAAICRGGQDNPFFHSAECKDIGNTQIILIPVAALLLIPPVAILLRRHLRSR